MTRQIVKEVVPVDIGLIEGEITKVIVSHDTNFLGIVRLKQPPMVEAVSAISPISSKSPKCLLQDKMIGKPAVNMAFRPYNRTVSQGPEVILVFGRGCKQARRWLLSSDESVELESIDVENACAVAWDADGRLLAIGDDNGCIQVFEPVADDIKPYCEIQGPRCRVSQIAIQHCSDSTYCLYYTDIRGDVWCAALEKGATSLVAGSALVSSNDGSLTYDWQCNTVSIYPYFSQKWIIYAGETKQSDSDNQDDGDASWKPHVWLHNGKNAFVEIYTHIGRTRHVQFLRNARDVCIIGADGIEIWTLDPLKHIRTWRQDVGYKVLNAYQYPDNTTLYVFTVPATVVQKPSLSPVANNTIGAAAAVGKQLKESK